MQLSLALEYQRFEAVDAEYLALTRRAARDPRLRELAAEGGGATALRDQLDRMRSQLGRVQAALASFLETQREAFPRFYFLPDDDLLEVLGGGRLPAAAQRHLRSLFGGIAAVGIGDDESGGDGSSAQIVSVSSVEGEQLALLAAVDTAEASSAHGWLSQLDGGVREALSGGLRAAIAAAEATLDGGDAGPLVEDVPAQLGLLALKIVWARRVEGALNGGTGGGGWFSRALSGGKQMPPSPQSPLARVADACAKALTALSAVVAGRAVPLLARRRGHHLISELVREIETARSLLADGVTSTDDFRWRRHLRVSLRDERRDEKYHLAPVLVAAGDVEAPYGWEWGGACEQMVHTPLTARAYLALLTALDARLGGSPFGPAGTGKTETVKALGGELGRRVVVFNCDDSFDYEAMGRLFLGLCRVGAWGCFDEFNRLEERTISAISQSILAIQTALRGRAAAVEIDGRSVALEQGAAVFVTMNPGYAGRSHLPDNLKALFRAVAMAEPDRQMIAHVMLRARGFSTAAALARRAVLLFEACADQLSNQRHYDFGLRALKAALIVAARLKDNEAAEAASGDHGPAAAADGAAAAEDALFVRSVRHTLLPRLAGADVPAFEAIVRSAFPNAGADAAGGGASAKLVVQLKATCADLHLVCEAGWLAKVEQLHAIVGLHHGAMLVGPAGCGKTTAWRCLLAALASLDGVAAESHVIDAKAVGKGGLIGTLDPTTREWHDGALTATIRRVNESAHGEGARRHWIVLDGDVDPTWVEALNSVLDDNKMLTLPSGERLPLPPNLRILFEVDSLAHATPATVSRCGMVCFGPPTAAAAADRRRRRRPRRRQRRGGGGDADDHAAPHCASRMLSRGVATRADRGR